MIRRLRQGLGRRLERFARENLWCPDRRCPESVYFYTFHKCASTLFADYLLPRAEGLWHVDDLHRIYAGDPRPWTTFGKRGFVFGPIRIEGDDGDGNPLARAFLDRVCDPEFVRGKTAVFMVRDPRDLLVSAYFSFGFTHEWSPVPVIREHQKRQRERVRASTIDEYALEMAGAVVLKFEHLDRLREASAQGTVLRYEDMICDWDTFAAGLSQTLAVAPDVLSTAYVRTRPLEIEDPTSHRRSGHVGDYRKKLRLDTIAALDDAFSEIFDRYSYARSTT